jgi:hypothetical protein
MSDALLPKSRAYVRGERILRAQKIVYLRRRWQIALTDCAKSFHSHFDRYQVSSSIKPNYMFIALFERTHTIQTVVYIDQVDSFIKYRLVILATGLSALDQSDGARVLSSYGQMFEDR